MQKEIKHTFHFNQSPEEVWEYLTKAELLAQWLMKTDFEPVLGRHFQFRSNPIPSLNLDGIFDCEVLDIEPFKKLTYTWKGGPGNGITTFDTVVLWTLDAKDNGTELHLVQNGFKEENISIFMAMDGGWFANVQKMAGLLNTKNNTNA